jgi:hypothetical protein
MKEIGYATLDDSKAEDKVVVVPCNLTDKKERTIIMNIKFQIQ